MTDRPGTSSVISVGRLYCDLIFSGIPRMPSFGTEIYASGFAVHAGGGACITAAHLARLGRSSQLAAFLPSGPFGPTVRGEIRSAGVDLRLCQPAGADWPLQVTAALVGAEDRAFVTNRSGPAAPRLSPEVLRASGARHVHVGELATLIEMPEILGAARAAGLSISLDCSWDESLLAGDISPLLGHVDVFLPNASEARRLGELGIAGDAARLTVIKDGANGARATMDGTTVSARVERALTPVDTTGAGDAFNAGFLHAWLEAAPIETCLRAGNAAGGEAIMTLGGFKALPTATQFDLAGVR